jgi:putative oxidoreductase
MFRYCEKGATYAAVVLRLVLGIIFFVHGAHKVGNMSETIEGLSTALGLSPFTVFVVVAIELLGGIGLLLGLFTRLAAAAIGINMIGAVILVHGQHGFFLQNHGYEYNLALFGMCVALILSGAGPFSVDAKFAELRATKLQRHSYQEREINESKV